MADAAKWLRLAAGAGFVVAVVGCSTQAPKQTADATPPTTPPSEVQPAATTPRADDSRAPLGLIGTTTNVRRVTFAEEGEDFDPSVSADGTKLVFASTQHRPTSDIYIKRTDSRVVTQLTSDPADDAMPAISPDGSKIAFASNRSGNWDIYVMPITGGKAVQITGEGEQDIQPSWSPDGTQLVFARMGAASGRWELWVTSIQNPATANFIGYGLHPRWCPVTGTGEGGSDKILFQLGRERGRRTFSIWTLDYTNGSATNTTEIASSATDALINPTWSPDGHWIAYAQASADLGTGLPTDTKEAPTASALWMLSVEGEGKVRLTTDAAASLSPTWAGSNRLYFASTMSGTENIWSLDVTQAVNAAMSTMPATNTASTGEEGTNAGHVATVPETGTEPQQH